MCISIVESVGKPVQVAGKLARSLVAGTVGLMESLDDLTYMTFINAQESIGDSGTALFTAQSPGLCRRVEMLFEVRPIEEKREARKLDIQFLSKPVATIAYGENFGPSRETPLDRCAEQIPDDARVFVHTRDVGFSDVLYLAGKPDTDLAPGLIAAALR